MNGRLTRPAIEAVFTTCASSPCASSRGTKLRRPWTTPQKLTPSTHCQSAIGTSHEFPPTKTPALLQTRCTAPKASIVASGERIDVVGARDVGAHGQRLDAGGGELLRRALERRRPRCRRAPRACPPRRAGAPAPARSRSQRPSPPPPVARTGPCSPSVLEVGDHVLPHQLDRLHHLRMRDLVRDSRDTAAGRPRPLRSGGRSRGTAPASRARRRRRRVRYSSVSRSSAPLRSTFARSAA